MSQAPEFFEAGVFYYHNRFPNLEPIPAAFTAVEYKWEYVPTGATGISKIWLDSKQNQQKDIKRLTDHWSNKTWKYEPVGKCQA